MRAGSKRQLQLELWQALMLAGSSQLIAAFDSASSAAATGASRMRALVEPPPAGQPPISMSPLHPSCIHPAVAGMAGDVPAGQRSQWPIAGTRVMRRQAGG
jgi:hypothetical protein